MNCLSVCLNNLNTTLFVVHAGRSFPIRFVKEARDINRLLKRLEELSRPNQRLFVGPADLRRTNYNDTYVYHLMPQLHPATYFLEMIQVRLTGLIPGWPQTLPAQTGWC